MNETIKFYPSEKTALYPSTDLYFIERSRQDGEADLERLVDAVEQEGCWLFTPNTSRWYNISTGQWDEYGNKNMLIKKRASIAIPIVSQMGGIATLYHTHPRNLYYQAQKAFTNGTDNAPKVIPEDYMKCQEIQTSFPSSGDMSGFMNFLRLNQDSHIDFRLVSPQGSMQIKFYDGYNPEQVLYQYTLSNNVGKVVDNALKYQETRDAISKMIERINYGLDGKCEFSMKFR